MHCLIDESPEAGCCCCCRWQLAVCAHPANTGFARGRISEVVGWVCTMPNFSEPEVSRVRSAIFFDTPHGLCEMYEPADQ